MDKLDGKISEGSWTRKSDEWRAEEQRTCAEMLALEQIKPERLLDNARILELAHKAHFLSLKQTPEDIWLVSFMDYDLGYFDLETRVLEPLENPFGPKVLPM
jgi:hypothetical protein